MSHLDSVTPKVKYPKTYHLPYSPGTSRDDKILVSDKHFQNMKEILITEKLDGENWSGYHTGVTHARSLDSSNEKWQTWAKNFWSQRAIEFPNNWRICGESMYAQHSIRYEELESFLYIFSIWDDRNICLSVKDTLIWCKLLDLIHVPILYQGPYDIKIISSIIETISKKPSSIEGFVIRNSESFHYDYFDQNVAKWVRPNHVTTETHWKETWIPNKLKQ